MAKLLFILNIRCQDVGMLIGFLVGRNSDVPRNIQRTYEDIRRTSNRYPEPPKRKSVGHPKGRLVLSGDAVSKNEDEMRNFIKLSQ